MTKQPVLFNRFLLEAKKNKPTPLPALTKAVGVVVDSRTGTVEWNMNNATVVDQPEKKDTAALKERYVVECMNKGMGLNKIVLALDRMSNAEKRRRFGTDRGFSRSTIAPIHSANNPSPIAKSVRKKFS